VVEIFETHNFIKTQIW